MSAERVALSPQETEQPHRAPVLLLAALAELGVGGFLVADGRIEDDAAPVAPDLEASSVSSAIESSSIGTIASRSNAENGPWKISVESICDSKTWIIVWMSRYPRSTSLSPMTSALRPVTAATDGSARFETAVRRASAAIRESQSVLTTTSFAAAA